MDSVAEYCMPECNQEDCIFNKNGFCAFTEFGCTIVPNDGICPEKILSVSNKC